MPKTMTTKIATKKTAATITAPSLGGLSTSLPRGVVVFQRLEFAVFDRWSLFVQRQPIEQLGKSVEIPTGVDDGFGERRGTSSKKTSFGSSM
jgi:hypothetical protein